MNLEEAIKATELSEETVYCEIDPETREISVPETYRIIGVESDEDVERVWFKCPKVVGDNIDLSKYQLRVNYQNANSDKGQYIITDLKIDGDNIIFSWLIGRLVAAYVGQVSFIICAVNVGSSDIKNEWNTTLAHSQVLTGLEVETQDLPTTGDDLINQLKSLTAQTQAFTNIAQAASESAQDNANKVQRQADRVDDILENVPDFEEYDTLAQLEKSFYEGRKYNVMTYAGKTSDKGVKLHSVKGKTVQQTTNGYQLFDSSKISSLGGITATKNDDGSITLNGTATSDVDFFKIGAWGQSEVVLSGTTKWKADVSNSNIKIIGVNGTSQEKSTELSTAENSYTGELTYFLMRVPQGKTLNNFTFKFMLYQDGDGTWEPYTGGKPAPNPDYPMEIENVEISKIISHGRQLFDASKIPTKSQGGATVTNNGDGSFTISGNGTLSEIFSAIYVLSNEETKRLFRTGKVYMKDSINQNGFYLEAKFLSSSGNKYLRNNNYIELTEDTISDVTCIVQIYAETGTTIPNTTIKPMLYQDGDGTWEPFKHASVETSLTLAEGDIYENGQVTRVRKQITFDGSSDESWSRSQTNEKTYKFNSWLSDCLGTLWLDKTGQVCNRLPVGNTWSEIKGDCFSIDNSKNLTVYIDDMKNATVEEFKTWLQSHPLIVEYELETPTTEELKIPTIPSYFPYTDVSTDNELETDITWKVLADCDNSLKQEALEKRIEALEQNALGE